MTVQYFMTFRLRRVRSNKDQLDPLVLTSDIYGIDLFINNSVSSYGLLRFFSNAMLLKLTKRAEDYIKATGQSIPVQRCDFVILCRLMKIG
jgi:hypothetical protein